MPHIIAMSKKIIRNVAFLISSQSIKYQR